MNEDQPERDNRTFPERVEKVNLAFLVQVPVKTLDRLASLIEDGLNSTGARLVYTKVSSNRLFIDEAPPRDRDDRGPERRRYSFGTDQ